jgi:hypothetical protein
MSRDCHILLCDVTAHEPFTRTQRKHSFLYFSVRVFRAWPRDDVLLLLPVGTCLRSCCLAMGMHVTILNVLRKSAMEKGCRFSFYAFTFKNSIKLNVSRCGSRNSIVALRKISAGATASSSLMRM